MKTAEEVAPMDVGASELMAARQKLYDAFTPEQRAELFELARRMEEAKSFPGGLEFQVDLMLGLANKAGLVIIDKQAYEAIRSSQPQWRDDVENAPKDGSYFLAWMAGDVYYANWDDDRYVKKPKPFFSAMTRWNSKAWSRLNQPTHWQPLPPPPQPQEPPNG